MYDKRLSFAFFILSSRITDTGFGETPLDDPVLSLAQQEMFSPWAVISLLDITLSCDLLKLSLVLNQSCPRDLLDTPVKYELLLISKDRLKTLACITSTELQF